MKGSPAWQSLARIEINDWQGDGGIMPTRGRLFTPPPHFREVVGQLLSCTKKSFQDPPPHHLAPPTVSDGNGTNNDRGM